jgi:hypothetical protein
MVPYAQDLLPTDLEKRVKKKSKAIPVTDREGQ